MQLVIGKDYGNIVHLTYSKSKTKPQNSPSYFIDKDNADEFVKKYNKQNKNLQVLTGFLTVLFGVAGAYANKNMKVLGVIISAFIGMFTGSMIAHEKNMKLMEKYDVKSYFP